MSTATLAQPTATTPAADTILSLNNIEVIYDHVILVLKGVSLQVPRKGIVAILGANGAGKTTLISIICGLGNPSTGSVRADGHDIVAEYRAARAKIGLVPQELTTDAFETVFPSEKFAFGHGDIHLPVGWGAIPWEAVMERCVFPDGVLFNIELNPRLWYAVDECLANTRALAERARTAPGSRPAGGLEVAGAVVNDDAVRGGEIVALQQDAIDRRVGLDDAFMRGDDDTVEALQEGEADQALGPFLAREIGDGVDLVAAPLQLLQNGHAVLDHAGHGLVPALVGR